MTHTWDEPGTQELRHPTPAELTDPRFNAVWNAIKKWDIRRTAEEGYGGYAGATGTDVCTILDALEPFEGGACRK